MQELEKKMETFSIIDLTELYLHLWYTKAVGGPEGGDFLW